MRPGKRVVQAMAATAMALSGTAHADAGRASAAPDPRLRELVYDPQAVVNVPVKRGLVALVVLDADEAITDVAAGLGGDCNKPESPWCIAAQPGGRTLFIKAKASASGPNNLAVITNRRTHLLRLEVLADGDRTAPVYRLVIKAPPLSLLPLPKRTAAFAGTAPALANLPPLPALPPAPAISPSQLVAERLQAKPQVINTQYALAEGPASQDILPTLVFDDGRFTYLRFPGNREVPAVFHVQGDGSESLANSRMEDDLLVLDRVSRRLVLRAGTAVVGLWNEAFDLEGRPPAAGTTVPGVKRVLKAEAALRAAAQTEEASHD